MVICPKLKKKLHMYMYEKKYYWTHIILYSYIISVVFSFVNAPGAFGWWTVKSGKGEREVNEHSCHCLPTPPASFLNKLSWIENWVWAIGWRHPSLVNYSVNFFFQKLVRYSLRSFIIIEYVWVYDNTKPIILLKRCAYLLFVFVGIKYPCPRGLIWGWQFYPNIFKHLIII